MPSGSGPWRIRAKSQAATTLQNALAAQSAMQAELDDSLEDLDAAIDSALIFLNNLPYVSATRETIEDVIDRLPVNLKTPYLSASTALQKAREDLKKASDAASAAASASNRAAREVAKKLEDLDLKKGARDAPRVLAGAATRAIDTGLAGWQRIVAFDEKVRQVMIVAMPMAGQMIADGVPGNDDNVVPGTASFLARMMDRDVDDGRLNEEYRLDSSRKYLPVFAWSGAGSVSAMLGADGLPAGPDAGLQAMLNFKPVYNAMALSKLTLLDGSTLNCLARAAGVGTTAYDDGAPGHGGHLPALRIPLR